MEKYDDIKDENIQGELFEIRVTCEINEDDCGEGGDNYIYQCSNCIKTVCSFHLVYFKKGNYFMCKDCKPDIWNDEN